MVDERVKHVGFLEAKLLRYFKRLALGPATLDEVLHVRDKLVDLFFGEIKGTFSNIHPRRSR